MVSCERTENQWVVNHTQIEAPCLEPEVIGGSADGWNVATIILGPRI